MLPISFEKFKILTEIVPLRFLPSVTTLIVRNMQDTSREDLLDTLDVIQDVNSACLELQDMCVGDKGSIFIMVIPTYPPCHSVDAIATFPVRRACDYSFYSPRIPVLQAVHERLPGGFDDVLVHADGRDALAQGGGSRPAVMV